MGETAGADGTSGSTASSTRIARGVTLIIVGLCGTASVVLTWMAGRRNPSVVLMILFMGWVLAPFAGMLWLCRGTGKALLMGSFVVLALGSTLLYAMAVMHPVQGKVAGPFLMTPLGTWVLLAFVMGIVWVGARRRR